MPIDTEDSGFLSRWSRRKVLVRQGGPVVDVAGPAVSVEAAPLHLPLPLAVAAPQAAAATGTAQTAVTPPALPAAAPDPSPEGPPPPTLADVAALTRESDYSRFVGRGVQPDVKNAALTKLFTDPHFNVMDRLDVYIDDYSKPDPIPEGWLEKMYQVTRLGDFRPKEQAEKEAAEKAASAAAQLDKPAEEQQVATGPVSIPSDTSVPENAPSDTANRPPGKEA